MTYMLWGILAAILLLFSFWRLWENFGVKSGPSKWGDIDEVLIIPIFIVFIVLLAIVRIIKILILVCMLRFNNAHKELKDLKYLWK